MNNPFSTSLSLHSLLNELIEDLKDSPNYNIFPIEDIENETDSEIGNIILHEFKSSYNSEIGFNGQLDNFGIYLTFSPKDDEDRSEFYHELYEHWYIFIQPLKKYLESLFSENTNNDACSFEINFNTNHNDISEEGFWEIIVIVSDYLS
jgi:hypothetical protein